MMDELTDAIEQSKDRVRALREQIAVASVEPVRESLMAQARTAVEKQHEVAAKIESLGAFKALVSNAVVQCADAYADWIRERSIADLDGILIRRRVGLRPNSDEAPGIFSAFSRVMQDAGFDPGDGLGAATRYWGGEKDWHFYVGYQSARSPLPTFAAHDNRRTRTGTADSQ